MIFEHRAVTEVPRRSPEDTARVGDRWRVVSVSDLVARVVYTRGWGLKKVSLKSAKGLF